MAHTPSDAIAQQAGQGSVDRGVGLAEDARQLRRVDERHPAEGVEQLSVGECHVSSVAKEGRAEHPSSGSAGVWEGSGRRSLGPSSWPRSRSSPRAAAGSQSPQPRPCSRGRSPLNRIGSGRRSRSARGARPEDTMGGHHDAVSSHCSSKHGHFLLPIFRWGIDSSSSSPPFASDGPSGEAAGMEANKRRLTLDLASTLQHRLKVWRSRASACAGAVKPPSTGKPTKGEADTPLLGSAMRHSQHAMGRLPGNMPSVPG